MENRASENPEITLASLDVKIDKMLRMMIQIQLGMQENDKKNRSWQRQL